MYDKRYMCKGESMYKTLLGIVYVTVFGYKMSGNIICLRRKPGGREMPKREAVLMMSNN